MQTLLFYGKPLSLNRDLHRNTRLKAESGNFTFATNTNSVPLAAIEFVDTSREYTIVFTGEEGGAMFPAALLGVRHNENLFVSEEGGWDARYVPAFVRRYPFVLAEKEAGDDFDVFIDESYGGFDAEDGERLFTDEGEDTPLPKQALDFLSNYQGEIKRTRDFVAKLQELDLLTPKTLQIERSSEGPLVLKGFSVIDEQRLAALTDAQLGELVRIGYMGWIYSHLLSLGQVSLLSERLGVKIDATKEEGSSEKETTKGKASANGKGSSEKETTKGKASANGKGSSGATN
jgi:hypothetical protein